MAKATRSRRATLFMATGEAGVAAVATVAAAGIEEAAATRGQPDRGCQPGDREPNK